MEYFNRPKIQDVENFLSSKEHHKNVLIVAGARQVGKTTLLEHVLSNRPHLTLNLERTPSIASHIDACESFDDFTDYLADEHQFTPSEKILFIDEAQKSTKLGSFVRFMKEEWKNANVILTGSAIEELHYKTERRPVGRETYFELWPLTFKEFLMALAKDAMVRTMEQFELDKEISASKHEQFIKYYDEYLKVGGLPEIVRLYAEGKDYEKQRADIYKTYEDDFVRYYSLDEVNLFKRSMEAVAANAGSPSKDSQVIRVDGPGYKKVAGILARLEKWRLIIKCEQLGVEPEKNKYFPKRYLYDLGILNMLRYKGMAMPGLKDLELNALRTPMGGVIENSVALSLKNIFNDNVFSIKLGTNTDIDFAIKYKNRVLPIECKMSFKFKGKFLNALDIYAKNFQKKKQTLLLYGGPPLAKPAGHTHILPFYLCDEIKRIFGNEA